MAELGLSDPLYMQYGNWLRDIAKGELGKSFFRDDSVADLIIRLAPLLTPQRDPGQFVSLSTDLPTVGLR
ncbi:hypothetical protein C2W62_53885 [Candidatus Entotheonella serta]|nr:hypothetical protein C2W62_53885 [Candidatus Entotheonella serta]